MFLNKCQYLIERTSYSCVIFHACFPFMKEIISEHHLERLVILPFPSMGCISDSSVAVVTNQTKKHKSSESNEDETRRQGKENPNGVAMRRNYWGFLSFPKFGVSRGVQRLMKRVKSFSQLFVYKEEVEEIEKELEIGYPTDVKHVTHIGWDGSTTINPVKGWENLKPPELLTSPSISLEQFELAMAAQAGAPLGVNCSKLTNS